jgi:hypothetical protein
MLREGWQGSTWTGRHRLVPDQSLLLLRDLDLPLTNAHTPLQTLWSQLRNNQAPARSAFYPSRQPVDINIRHSDNNADSPLLLNSLALATLGQLRPPLMLSRT